MNPKIAILLHRPELWLALTLGIWVVAQKCHQRWPRLFLCQPVPLTIALLVCIMGITHTPFDVYYQGSQWLHWLLGPATVAMAFPLYRQWSLLKANALALLFILILSSLASLMITWGLGKLGMLSPNCLAACMTKSLTTPIALASSQTIGADPSLAVLMVIVTGIFGATWGTAILNFLRISDPRARGFAIGFSSHGLGAASAYPKSEQKGAWASLAMVLNGILTPILLPIIWTWLN